MFLPLHAANKTNMDTDTPVPASNGDENNASDVEVDTSSDASEFDSDDIIECQFAIAIGTYDHIVHGYHCRVAGIADSVIEDQDDADETAQDLAIEMAPVFATESHAAPVSSLAGAGETLVSGSADEQIQVYNISRRVESGTLILHEATITCIRFFDQVTMLSASQDGSIVIWDAKSWDHLKVMKGHKGAVNDLTIHKSGALALSVGRDRSLRTWDLTKGRCVYITMRPQEATLVRFTKSGDFYVVGSHRQLMAYSVATNELVFTTELEFRISELCILEDDIVVVCGYGPYLHFFDVKRRQCTASLAAHDESVKFVQELELPGQLHSKTLLCTCDRAGLLRVWQLPRAAIVGVDTATGGEGEQAEADAADANDKDVSIEHHQDLALKPIAELRVKSRITSMTAFSMRKAAHFKTVMGSVTSDPEALKVYNEKAPDDVARRAGLARGKKVKKGKDVAFATVASDKEQAAMGMTEGLPQPVADAQTPASSASSAAQAVRAVQAAAKHRQHEQRKKQHKASAKQDAARSSAGKEEAKPKADAAESQAAKRKSSSQMSEKKKEEKQAKPASKKRQAPGNTIVGGKGKRTRQAAAAAAVVPRNLKAAPPAPKKAKHTPSKGPSKGPSKHATPKHTPGKPPAGKTPKKTPVKGKSPKVQRKQK